LQGYKLHKSGEPGSGVSIRVRGNTSIRSGNGPLIVVDGVPLDGGNVSGGGDNLLELPLLETH
jgi:iron complex outermembrane receptor protein